MKQEPWKEKEEDSWCEAGNHQTGIRATAQINERFCQSTRLTTSAVTGWSGYETGASKELEQP